MKIVITDNYEEMSRESANFIIKSLLSENKKMTLGLATGNTPTGLYKELTSAINKGILGDNIIYFNIDEYCDIDLNKNGTCNKYLVDNFYNNVNIPAERAIYLNENNYGSYEDMLSKLGGIDVVILGIGENGHIAYNEPYAKFNTLTHVQYLSETSKLQHGEEFGGKDKVPPTAVTIGIRTIMNAKHVLLMASGDKKAEAIKKALQGEITEEMPASILQLHPNLHVVVDKEAAKLL